MKRTKSESTKIQLIPTSMTGSLMHGHLTYGFPKEKVQLAPGKVQDDLAPWVMRTACLPLVQEYTLRKTRMI